MVKCIFDKKCHVDQKVFIFFLNLMVKTVIFLKRVLYKFFINKKVVAKFLCKNVDKKSRILFGK